MGQMMRKMGKEMGEDMPPECDDVVDRLEAGLRYVYAGNLPRRVEEYEDTFCSHCSTNLIKRSGYVIQEYHITASGQCPSCGTKVPGVWMQNPSKIQLNGYGMPILDVMHQDKMLLWWSIDSRVLLYNHAIQKTWKEVRFNSHIIE